MCKLFTLSQYDFYDIIFVENEIHVIGWDCPLWLKGNNSKYIFELEQWKILKTRTVDHRYDDVQRYINCCIFVLFVTGMVANCFVVLLGHIHLNGFIYFRLSEHWQMAHKWIKISLNIYKNTISYGVMTFITILMENIKTKGNFFLTKSYQKVRRLSL